MGQQHALLIGIDAYDGGGSLTGCVNDIGDVHDLLTQHVGIDAARITRLASPTRQDGDRLPTRAAITDELARLAELAPSDRVLIYYSGHGTQTIVAGRDGARFSREALLPKDKVVGPQRRYLFDWQINQLIGAIAARVARVTVILDCCASAGVTRDTSGGIANTRDRFYPSDGVYQLREEDGWGDSRVRGIISNVGVVPDVQLIAACATTSAPARRGLTTGRPTGCSPARWCRRSGTSPGASSRSFAGDGSGVRSSSAYAPPILARIRTSPADSADTCSGSARTRMRTADMPSSRRRAASSSMLAECRASRAVRDRRVRRATAAIPAHRKFQRPSGRRAQGHGDRAYFDRARRGDRALRVTRGGTWPPGQIRARRAASGSARAARCWHCRAARDVGPPRDGDARWRRGCRARPARWRVGHHG